MITHRQSRLDLNTQAELAIHNAIQEIEKIGADERLTDAVISLLAAKESVGSYIDEQMYKAQAPSPFDGELREQEKLHEMNHLKERETER